MFNWQLPKCRCGMGQAQVVLDNAKMDAKKSGKGHESDTNIDRDYGNVESAC